jgi:hypothetical protein
MSNNHTSGTESTAIKSVVVRVIETFVAAVEAAEGYSEVAARLRGTLLEKNSRSESALKIALFGEEPS